MIGSHVPWGKLLATVSGRILLTSPEKTAILSNVDDPIDELDAANKKYVDEAVAGGGGSGSIVIAASNNIVPEGTGTEEDPILLNVQDVVFTSGDNFLSGTLRTSSEFNDTRVDIRPDQGGIIMERSSLDAFATYSPSGLSIVNTATSSITTVSASSTITPEAFVRTALYLGPDGTGQWKIELSGDNLSFKRYDGANWIEKSTIAG